jgi:hypothetical protein
MRVFVFGSNLAGRHNESGAAKHAADFYYAEHGTGVGPTGMAYAIPTKDEKLKVLPLSTIESHFANFVDYAIANPDTTFEVTPFGTGLAGYSKKQIAAIISKYKLPSNIVLSTTWITT